MSNNIERIDWWDKEIPRLEMLEIVISKEERDRIEYNNNLMENLRIDMYSRLIIPKQYFENNS